MIKFNEILNPENKFCIKCSNLKEFGNTVARIHEQAHPLNVDLDMLRFSILPMYDASSCVTIEDSKLKCAPELYFRAYQYTVVNYQDVDFSI